MYLVDTSVWIDFFRGKQTSAVEQTLATVERLLENLAAAAAAPAAAAAAAAPNPTFW